MASFIEFLAPHETAKGTPLNCKNCNTFRPSAELAFSGAGGIDFDAFANEDSAAGGRKRVTDVATFIMRVPAVDANLRRLEVRADHELELLARPRLP